MISKENLLIEKLTRELQEAKQKIKDLEAECLEAANTKIEYIQAFEEIKTACITLGDYHAVLRIKDILKVPQ